MKNVLNTLFALLAFTGIVCWLQVLNMPTGVYSDTTSWTLYDNIQTAVTHLQATGFVCLVMAVFGYALWSDMSNTSEVGAYRPSQPEQRFADIKAEVDEWYAKAVQAEAANREYRELHNQPYLGR